MMMMNNDSPFYKPISPKNSWQLLSWCVFEPLLVRRYAETLNKDEQVVVFLKSYICLSIILFFIWLLGNLLMVVFDIPSIFIVEYGKVFQYEWQKLSSIIPKYIFLLKLTFTSFNVALVGSLLFGFFFSLTGYFSDLNQGLISSLAISLFCGIGMVGTTILTAGLLKGLAFALVRGSIYGLSFSFSVRLIRLFEEYVFKFPIGVFFGLIYGLTESLGKIINTSLSAGLILGFTEGLAVITSYYFSYYRLYIFPIHLLRFNFKLNLSNNPYIEDGVIHLSLFSINNSLSRQAFNNPSLANQFIIFLLEYRPLQRGLAMQLTHASKAGQWQQSPLDTNVFLAPIIDEKQEKYLPSKKWFTQLESIRIALIDFHQMNNIWQKEAALSSIIEQMHLFQDINLRESNGWNQFYHQAIIKLTQEAQEQLNRLREQTQQKVKNPYQTGDALYPQNNQQVFRGRTDVKTQLSDAIYSADRMPMFLIQGQRRVGKTSLLNFLPNLLGQGFKIIKFDLQEATEGQDIATWMTAIRRKINQSFHQHEEHEWQANQNDWLQSWVELSAYLISISQIHSSKIILAFDEYEKLHENFSANRGKAGDLLGAMRAFVQQQNQVVFLFVGAAFFFELENPRWSDYFPQAVHLPIDYLSQSDAVALLKKPYKDYKVKFQDGVLEQVYQLTQGHPSLIQKVGYEIVQYCNQNNILDIETSRILQLIDNKILMENVSPFSVFWKQFCEAPEMKQTVLAILKKETILDKESIKKLLRHQFIIKNENNTYSMRVPLFEMWVRKFEIDF